MTKSNKFKSLHAFSGFSVDDIKLAKDFYKNVLNLDVIENGVMGLEIKITPDSSVFVYPKENHVPATFTILNLVVKNIDDAVDSLTEKGVQFERYDGFKQDEKGISRSESAQSGPSIAWFKDPAGNIMSVLEE